MSSHIRLINISEDTKIYEEELTEEELAEVEMYYIKHNLHPEGSDLAGLYRLRCLQYFADRKIELIGSVV